MPKFSFPLVKSTPTDSEYAEICTGGGLRPHCQLKASAFSGAAPPSDTYGNLSVVNLPLESETAGCETLIEVFMQTGCPPGTPDVICDDAQNPTEIAPNSSETIYILDGNPPYTWEITGGHGYSLEHESTNDLGGRPDQRLNSQNTLHASADSCGTAKVKITDNCQTEIICEFDSSIASDFEYDWTNSGQTVARNGNVDVLVTGGTPPYTWDVSGTGFSLQNIETYSATNTVYANSTACGSGVITVEDVCGIQVEGGIRCSDSGSWVEISGTIIGLRGYVNSGACIGFGNIEGYQGIYKMLESINIVCQDIFACSTTPDCTGMSWTYFYGWDDYSSLISAGDPLDCMTFKSLPGCGGTAGIVKSGLCCKSIGSGVISRWGITNRRVWEWRCP